MYVDTFSAAGAKELPPNAAEDKLSFRETLEFLGDVVAESLGYVYASTPIPSHLVLEGEKLEDATHHAPHDQPPHNLLQAVLAWLRAVKQWMGKHVPLFKRPTLMQRVDRLESKVNALTSELHAFRQEVQTQFKGIQTQFEGVHKGLHDQRREFKGLLYGPALERCVRSKLPGCARQCLTPILQHKLRPEILHFDRMDNPDRTQRFQEAWWDGDYPDTERENPLLADIVLCLHPVTKEGKTVMLVCEIATQTDADDVERAYQRGQWLALHASRAICVIPLVIGEQWGSSAVETAAQYQIPCLGVRLHETDLGERGIEHWEPQSDFLKRLTYWIDHSPSLRDR